MTEVVLNAVSKVYPGGHLAVDDLSLHVRDGELFVLLGPSGCGKSTVLRMIAGLEEITSGDLMLGDAFANGLDPRERNVAMVFQNGALYPHLSVRGNLAFPLEIAQDDATATREKVVELAKALGLDPMLERRPSTLSGGQRQRVAMGRAIIREPSVFLMDEPLSNLDAALRTELRMEIAALVRSLGVTTLYVTHDQVEALTLADRIAIMRQGVLQDVGTPQQLYVDPATVFVAAFLSSPYINLLQANAWAVENEGVILDFGGQRLTVPWTDPRATAFMACHGSSVLVGIRPDALTPVSEPDPGRVLSGRLRSLEFHGHEWMAYAEAGIPAVDPDEVTRPQKVPVATPAPPTASGRLKSSFGRLFGSAEEAVADEPGVGTGHSGHHRRSDLVFRIGSSRGLTQGSTVHLAVDMDRILVFGGDGARVDRVQR
ncbi:ABC transporter ATP-binding protein [Actinomadura sp. HBU206391]|uniref:ABC transporter ATP-binding protein n=1 Tax=Actinomadura sp. HBU206391 TaxID=2731692 RepID=UPI00164EE868|nr:ATP-binding cassette domain-containing protein [Actinomadura sp. HBU206391]MBC6461297.1 ATP-binding cassette domain-containing protein [Actinomadura sp. HBU206391]